MRNATKMVNSVVWTPEEAKYLKAIFRWQETTSTLDDEKRRQQAEEAERRRQQEQQKPAGEFRVLVIGGRGTGKTAILTRVSSSPSHQDSRNTTNHHTPPVWQRHLPQRLPGPLLRAGLPAPHHPDRPPSDNRHYDHDNR